MLAEHFICFPKSLPFQVAHLCFLQSLLKIFMYDSKVGLPSISQTPTKSQLPYLSAKWSILWNHSCYSRFSMFHRNTWNVTCVAKITLGLSPPLPMSAVEDYCWLVSWFCFVLILSARSPWIQNDLNSLVNPWVFITGTDAKPAFDELLFWTSMPDFPWIC